MANANSNQTVINFGDAALNCSEYKDDVKNFNGFNYRNSPFLSGEVKPLYRKDFGAKSWVDYDLNEYKIDSNGRFYKNDNLKATLDKCVWIERYGFEDDALISQFNYSFLDYNAETGTMLITDEEIGIIKNIYGYTQQIGNWIVPDDYGNEIIIDGYLKCVDGLDFVVSIIITKHKTTGNFKAYIDALAKSSMPSLAPFDGFKDIVIPIDDPYNLVNIDVFGKVIEVEGDVPYYDIIIAPITIENSVYVTNKNNKLFNVWSFDGNSYNVIRRVRSIVLNSHTAVITDNIILIKDMLVFNNGASAIRSASNNLTTINLFQYSSYVAVVGVDNTAELYYDDGYSYLQPKMWSADFGKYMLEPTTPNTSFVFYTNDFVAITLGKYTLDTKDIYLTMVISRSLTTPVMLYEYNDLINLQKIPPFRVVSYYGMCELVNNQQLSSISVIGDDDYPNRSGTVIFPFYTIDTEDVFLCHSRINEDLSQFTEADGYIGAVKKDNALYIIRRKQQTENFGFNVLSERYLIFNTSDYYNCYDIVNDVFLHFADDWNSRSFFYNYNSAVSYKDTNNAMQRGWVASAVNAFFEAKKTISMSSQFNPICTVYRLNKNIDENYLALSMCQIPPKPADIKCGIVYYGIDMFYNSDITNSIPEYKGTFISIDNDIKRLKYDFGFEDDYTIEEANQLLIAPLFSKFYQYDLLNYAEMGALLKSPILRIGTFDYPVYYLLSAQEDFDIFFVIQTAAFGIKDGYVYSLVFENGILTNITRVASCKGLEFIASTPLNALFWAKQNQTLYSFKGNCLFEQGQTLDEVSSVIQAKYNPETTEVFLCTDKYVLVSAVNYTYKIPIVCTDIFFSKDGFVLRYTENNQSKLSVFTYNEDFWTDDTVTRVPIEIETSYYGIGNNSLTVIDCVYLRIYNNLKPIGTEHPEYNTYLKISADCICADHTIKYDNGRIWSGQPSSTQDNLLVFDEHKTAYIRWQPKIQNVVGMKINIETNCCVTFMAVGSSYQGKEITKY